MAWLRDDDDMLDHEKWRRAIRDGGDGVLLLWTRLRAWCSRRLTDGVIPPDMVDEVGQIGKSKSRARQLRALVDARLLAWCDFDDDVASLCRGDVEASPRARRDSDALVVVGYLQRNPSRVDVLAERGRRAQAQKNYKDRRKVTGHPSTSLDEEGSGADDVPSRPVPAPLIPRGDERERAREPRPTEVTADGADAARTYTMPSEMAPQEFLDAALMAGVEPAQAASTWKHYWGAGLPSRGVERLHAWLVQRAKERSNQLATVPRPSPLRDATARQAERVRMLREQEAAEERALGGAP